MFSYTLSVTLYILFAMVHCMVVVVDDNRYCLVCALGVLAFSAKY